MHKVKANEIHKYNWNNHENNKVEINAEDGKTYFIRGSFEAVGMNWNGMNDMNGIGMIGNSMSIFIDNPKIARYMVLTMKKESLTY